MKRTPEEMLIIRQEAKLAEEMFKTDYISKKDIKRICKEYGFKITFNNTYFEFGRQNFITDFYHNDKFIQSEHDQFETEKSLIDYLTGLIIPEVS